MTECRQNKRNFSKDKILKEKRNILKIVEWMLEKNLQKDQFLTYCEKLSQSDYNDIVEERSIDHLCGFPLCSKNIKVSKQKFHISTNLNKVYDITERKCFCSNECYKASNFVKVQLPTDPFWMREEKELKIKLISVLQNRGSAGEEVEFGFSLHKKKEKESSEESSLDEVSTPAQLLKKEMEKCSEQIKDLKIVENTFQPASSFLANKVTTVADGDSDNVSDETDSSTESEDSSSDSDSNVKYFTDYDNLDSMTDKLMPISKESKKTVLISPLNSLISKSDVTPKTLSLPFAHHVLTCWITEDSIKYLLGDYKLHSIKADMLFEKIAGSNHPSDKLNTMKKEYVELCLKLDRQEQEIDGFLVDDVECAVVENSAGAVVENPACDESSQIEPVKPPPVRQKSSKKSRRKKKNASGKTVSFASSTKQETCVEVKSEESIVLPTLPPIDSRSQNMLRKQVVTNRLKISYFDILPLIGQSFKYIMGEIIKLIDTFSLAPDNVTYKPKEWKLISLIIYRLLSRTVSKSLCDDEKFITLFELTKLPVEATLKEVDELITDVCGAQQLQRLQGSHQNAEPKLS